MKINKLLFIPALVLGALAINSCDADKLELKNPNDLSPETYFTTDAQLQSAVNSIYGSLQTTSLYNRHMWFGLDNMSHETSGNTQLEADKREYLDFTFNASHGAIEGFWESCYRGINKANFVINNVEKIALIPESVTPQERKDKFIGEAKFMRALYYFMLVNRYGRIPIYEIAPADNVGKARCTDVAEVWELIERDLVDATTLLLNKADEELGRATKGAAWALLGKARLYQEKYQSALDAFNEIEGYSLEPVFSNNFREETENGVESLFEVQFSREAGYSARWNSDRSDVGLNEACFRDQEYGWRDWFNVYPSDNLTAEYETAADNGVKTDPRLGFTIYQNGDTYFGGTVEIADVTTVLGGETEIVTRQGWNKYHSYYKQANVVDMSSGINMKVIRYADVLLMMAECEANRPSGDLDAAIALMNQVRQRGDVDMPLYDTPEMDAIYPVGNLTEFMDALEHERKVELAGEQIRFDDLLRWGKLDAFIAQLVSDPNIDPAWDNNGDGSWLPITEQAGLVYSAARNHLWPIPQAEIDRNTNIETTDQNPGYAQ
ncbi:MAG: RagB/SusD family nutrient uptake outer membrane protein [Bacteroidales bacterium]|nr:RagB/SusD family nutrient uptake outer membrane protein [Bacteroidales bacterium]